MHLLSANGKKLHAPYEHHELSALCQIFFHVRLTQKLV